MEPHQQQGLKLKKCEYLTLLTGHDSNSVLMLSHKYSALFINQNVLLKSDLLSYLPPQIISNLHPVEQSTSHTKKITQMNINYHKLIKEMWKTNWIWLALCS